jgi:hypothetical protein|tara:strand:- start:542 stop:763 length:222 start_codon:yes stop_codon:yes gene_type:complete
MWLQVLGRAMEKQVKRSTEYPDHNKVGDRLEAQQRQRVAKAAKRAITGVIILGAVILTSFLIMGALALFGVRS